MKNLIVVAVLVLLSAGAAPVLANGKDNDPRAEKFFQKQFTGAENVKWISLDNGYQRVVFTLNGTRVEAFYNQDAELLGSVRVLGYNQLPLLIIQSIERSFSGTSVLEVKEITTPEGTSYKILLEQKDKRYTLKLNSLGEVTEKTKSNK